MTGNGRIVENNCAKQQFELFIQRLKTNSEINLKSHKPATDTVMQDRFTFTCEGERISIVYEINSKTLVITANDHLLRLLKTELNSLAFSRSTEVEQPRALQTSELSKGKESAPKNQVKISAEPQKHTEITTRPQFVSSEAVTRIDAQKQGDVKASAQSLQQEQQIKPEFLKQPEIKAKPQQIKKVKQQLDEKPKAIDKVGVERKAKVEEKARAAKKQADDKAKAEAAKLLAVEEAQRLEELYKNGFSIKKYPPESIEGVLKKLKTLKGVTFKQLPNADSSRSYKIEDGKNKVYLRYIDTKKTLQLQGRRSKLFGEVQVLVSQESDYVTAVSSHIDLTGEEKRARDMEKRLKKLLPNGFDFLSEQSRIDLTIGMMDIGNDEVKLSDYSMLLVPPYRGLERLIFDLQRLKNIEVKMIGQAYEKTDAGEYVLKLGYRRKINSIVYAEVMSALYTEYFARRNFYAHSDITGDLLSRVITEKSAVREIFDRFIETIEYNIRKLKEIGLKPNA